MPFLLLNGCKKPVDLNSKWIDKEIVIDADDQDWKDYPFYYDENPQSLIGLYNDSENLYICFQTMDEDVQRQITRMGLVIWFNQTGDKEKQLGIGYPLGRQPGGPSGPMDEFSGRPSPPPERSSEMSDHSPDMESGDKNMPPKRPFVQGPKSMEELEILPSDDVIGFLHKPQKAAQIGIYARCTIDERGRFVYELKMPLMKTEKTPFAVATSAVKNIGIGFMTVEPEKSSEGGMGKGRRPGGGRPGGGGPGGGRPGGDMPERGMPDGRKDGDPDGDKGSRGKDMEIWFNVTLASNP
jgi:hypothetical protein